MASAAPQPHCTQCGIVLAAGAKFCVGCGAAVAAVTVPTAPANPAMPFPGGCRTCGGGGARLAPEQVFCPECRWLRPLTKDFRLPVDAFMWALDAQAMAVLRGIKPLTAAADLLSDKIGQPWFESSVNGIRLSPDQLPDIFEAAVDAARAVGLTRMPQVYVSGEAMWDCLTLGSDDEAFVTIGSVLTNLKGNALRYVLGREMGHVAAGHAMWKTVLQFLSGKSGTHRTIMGNGVLNLLSIQKLVEHAIDAPLMAWARHSEITADRAGALVVGDYPAIRQVMVQQTLRSFPLFARLNMEALEREVDQSNDRQLALSEWTMSSTPYLARRLKLMDDFFQTQVFKGWRAVIDYWDRPVPEDAPPPPRPRTPAVTPKPAGRADDVRTTCPGCQQPIRVPRADLKPGVATRVRCPTPGCGKVLALTLPKPPAPVPAPPRPEVLRVTCPACHQAMQAPKAELDGKESVDLRCPTAGCGRVVRVRRRAEPAERPAAGAS